MLRRFPSVVRASYRSFCSTTTPSLTRVAAADVWEDLNDTDWVDRETKRQEELVEKADAIIASYRSEYSPQTAGSGEEKETYEQVKSLYQMKEAAKIVDLYAGHIEVLMRDHEDMVGPLGNITQIPEGGADLATQTLTEYMEFVNGLESKAIRKKVEFELGRKIVVLKMVLSVENFSSRFAPIAGGDVITKTIK